MHHECTNIFLNFSYGNSYQTPRSLMSPSPLPGLSPLPATPFPGKSGSKSPYILFLRYGKIDLELMKDDSPKVQDSEVGQAAQVLPGIKISPGKGGILSFK